MSATNQATRVIIYNCVRPDDDDVTIPQLDECERQCKKYAENWKVVETVRDQGYPEDTNREKLEHAIGEIEAGNADIMLCRSVHSLPSNLHYCSRIEDRLEGRLDFVDKTGLREAALTGFNATSLILPENK